MDYRLHPMEFYYMKQPSGKIKNINAKDIYKQIIEQRELRALLQNKQTL